MLKGIVGIAVKIRDKIVGEQVEISGGEGMGGAVRIEVAAAAFYDIVQPLDVRVLILPPASHDRFAADQAQIKRKVLHISSSISISVNCLSIPVIDKLSVFLYNYNIGLRKLQVDFCKRPVLIDLRRDCEMKYMSRALSLMLLSALILTGCGQSGTPSETTAAGDSAAPDVTTDPNASDPCRSPQRW